MTRQYVGPQDASSSWSWPVRWEPAVRLAVARGRHPDVLLDDPNLVAHRVLDRLAAQALEVHRGAPGASEAFVDAIRALVLAAPWLVGTADRPDSGTAESHHAHDPHGTYGEGSGGGTTGSAQAPLEDALIDVGGVSALHAIAARLAGRDGATAVLGLAATAMAAEQWLPGLSHTGDARHRADILLLGGISMTGLRPQTGTFRGSEGAQPPEESASHADPVLIANSPIWERLGALARNDAFSASRGIAELHRCFELFDELMRIAESSQPTPNGPVTWTTGIQRVEVSAPCGASPLLTIHGNGFGATAPPGGAVVAPHWNQEAKAIIYAPVTVVSWSDSQVVVRLGSSSVGGTVAFANIGFVAEYNAWNREASRDVARTMHASGCPGFNQPNPPLLWPPFSLSPAPAPTATYQAGLPWIVADITRDPVGLAPDRWDGVSVHLRAGEPFWVVWRTVNADTAALRASGATGSQILVAAGHPASGVIGASGSVRLVAPSSAAVVEFTVEASNAACGIVRAPRRIVVTGPALGPAKITVLQSLPGGDVDLVLGDIVGAGITSEALDPPTGRSIPLVAEKRTVARIDWWPAVPQVPEGEQLRAVATLKVKNIGDWFLSGTLSPGSSTAEDPPTSSVTLFSGPPFSSVAQYQQWIDAGNEPATFNVVIPTEWCKWEVLLEATVRVFSPLGPAWDVTAATWVKFHRRRRVRIRYRRHTAPNRPTPTTQEAERAIRDAASLLPIPDPEILVLGNDPAAPSTGYIEDMFAERGGTPTSAWRDEIWLVVGPAGVGGFADIGRWPWIAATDATALTTAHEIGHLFWQNHLNLCGVSGDDPTLFPDNGNVVVIGWDMWNNRVVRGATDIMTRTYCPEPTWMSPGRWRRIFLQVGP
jgi:hypothetical protein